MPPNDHTLGDWTLRFDGEAAVCANVDPLRPVANVVRDRVHTIHFERLGVHVGIDPRTENAELGNKVSSAVEPIWAHQRAHRSIHTVWGEASDG